MRGGLIASMSERSRALAHGSAASNVSITTRTDAELILINDPCDAHRDLLVPTAGTSLRVPAAVRGRQRRPVVIWASDADPPNAGQRRHALLLARVIAGDCTEHPAVEILGTPWIAGRRLRRDGLDCAEQRRSDQEKRYDWQAHENLPERIAGPHPTSTLSHRVTKVLRRASPSIAFTKPRRPASGRHEIGDFTDCGWCQGGCNEISVGRQL